METGEPSFDGKGGPGRTARGARWLVAAGLVGALGCGGMHGSPPSSDEGAETTRFTSASACEGCHAAGPGVLRDAAGRDVSPTATWRSSIMANSARDPYWLAVFSRELQAHPEAADHIDATCTRCHAPAASEELAQSRGSHTGLERVLEGDTAVDVLGREGVTCTVRGDGKGPPSRAVRG
ncbi:MAG: hypothetical protein OXT09_06470, partial [Myxococcales bacterium]|nr:hypothetical protein [Myxococcales bacterium]